MNFPEEYGMPKWSDHSEQAAVGKVASAAALGCSAPGGAALAFPGTPSPVSFQAGRRMLAATGNVDSGFGLGAATVAGGPVSASTWKATQGGLVGSGGGHGAARDAIVADSRDTGSTSQVSGKQLVTADYDFIPWHEPCPKV